MRRLGSLLSVALLAVILCVLGTACAGVSAGPDPNNLIDIQERAQKDLTRKAGKYSEEARQKARESQSLLEQLNALRQEAAEAQAQVNRLEKEGKRLKEQSAALSQDITKAGGELSRLAARLGTRVVDIYKYSSQEGMNIFLSARNAHDVLTATYMLGRLVHRDQDLIRELVKKSASLTRSRAALEESQAQVQQQAAELRKRRAGLDETIRKTDALLKDIRRQQRKAEAAARELVQAQQELGNRIIALRKQRGTSSLLPSKLPQPQTPSPQTEPLGKMPPAPVPPEKRLQTYTWLPRGAALEWPVRGAITTPFGSRVHPVFRTKVFNSGIDIRAASGTPVRAAGPGEVLFRGWLRGFGQVVIIDHGRDLSTVYGHLATTAVNEGDAVRAGSIVGTAGNSGTNTEPGLHFEVRSSGTARNPLNYLKKIRRSLRRHNLRICGILLSNIEIHGRQRMVGAQWRRNG
ncbi:MAG: peptidoglycan DD-metalloendopeptidase family protein [Fretibacterium sp.]|nr:peptidoglycan DD-metalloendopeptidase family protein [Fretibacterium sp.]